MDKIVVNYKIINGKVVGERTVNVDGEIWNVTETDKSWILIKKDGKTTFKLFVSKKDCEKFENLAECVMEFNNGNWAID